MKLGTILNNTTTSIASPPAHPESADHFNIAHAYAGRSFIDMGISDAQFRKVTNGDVSELWRAYPWVHRGVFMEGPRGRARGDIHLLATGPAEGGVEQFEILAPEMLPPSLGIHREQTLEDFVREHNESLPSGFKILADSPRFIRPEPKRYDIDNNYPQLLGYESRSRLIDLTRRDFDPAQFNDPQEAATLIDCYMALAMAQLMGGQDLLEHLYNISGAHYVDLPVMEDAKVMLEWIKCDYNALSLLEKSAKWPSSRSLFGPQNWLGGDSAQLPEDVVPASTWQWTKGNPYSDNMPFGLIIAAMNSGLLGEGRQFNPNHGSINIGFSIAAK